MTKKAIVNGVEIGETAVNFELDRLMMFYTSHGMSAEEVKKNLPTLEARALDQAIGSRLLLEQAMRLDIPVAAADIDAEVDKLTAQLGGTESRRKALEAQGLSEEKLRKAVESGVKVNKLVEQACAGVAEPSDDEVAAFYEAHKGEYSDPNRKGGAKTLVDVQDQIKDLLRHEARGRATAAYVEELKAKACIEYK